MELDKYTTAATTTTKQSLNWNLIRYEIIFKTKGKTEAATISTTTCMHLERVANFSYSLIFSMATTRKIISFLLKIKILWNRISSIFGDNSKISSVIKNCLFEFFVKFLYIIEAILEIHQVILFKKKTYCYSYFTILFLNPLCCYGICLLKLKMSNSSSSGMTSELTHMSLTLLFWQFTIFVVSL